MIKVFVKQKGNNTIEIPAYSELNELACIQSFLFMGQKWNLVLLWIFPWCNMQCKNVYDSIYYYGGKTYNAMQHDVWEVNK